MTKKLFTYTLILSISMLHIACGKEKKTTSSSGIATVLCDESFENILSQEIEVFEYNYPNASIIPYYLDEKSAIDSLMAEKTELIIIPHELTDAHAAQLKLKNRNLFQQRIAVDAIALIVNKENPIDELSIQELREILIGETTQWDEIWPTKLSKIQVVFDHQGSSTVKYMKDSITDGKPFGSEVYAQNSNREVFDIVSNNKNAIGIIGVSWIADDMSGRTISMDERVQILNEENVTAMDFDRDIKVLAIRRNDNPRAYKPYQAYIYNGDYPLYRSIYAVSIAPRGSLSHGFLSFITGVIGQKIILQTGVVPAIIQPRVVEVISQ